MVHAKALNRRNFQELPLHLMLLPAVIVLLIYHYGPMIGIYMAFQKFDPVYGLFGSPWIGLDNFRYLLALPDTLQILWNTFYIAFMKITAGLVVPVTVALLLNEIGNIYVKRSIQTFVYLPHFLSWVILSGILIDVLSPNDGLVNQFIKFLGFQPIFFIGDQKWFPYTLVLTNVWKEFGYETIIYLAALTSIDSSLYEAAITDGANRWKQTIHITIPGIIPIIVLMTTLSLGKILNAGFEQVFNLYSPQVYKTGDILDTFVYRIGLLEAQYGVATAVGLFKSAVSFVFIATSYKLAEKFANYRIF